MRQEGFLSSRQKDSFLEDEDAFRVDVCDLKKLLECHGEGLFDVVFKGGYLGKKLFPPPCKLLKVRRREAGFPKVAMKHAQEACYGEGILFVGLGLPEGELHEVRNDEGIDDHRMIAFFGKKDGEVNMIAGRGFFPDEDGVLRKFQEMSGEFIKSSCFHRCGKLKKFMPLLVYGTCREGIFK